MQQKNEVLDTLVVPATPEGFQKVFLGEQQWYAFKLSKTALNELKFLCIYQTKPVSAITHIAEIERLEIHEDKKYRAILKPNSIVDIGPIKYNSSSLTAIQSPRYFSLQKIIQAKSLTDLVG